MDPYQNYQPGQNGFPPPQGQGVPPQNGWQNGPYQQPNYRQPNYQQPNYRQPQYGYQQPPYQPQPPHPGKEKAKNAMIIGIIAAVAMFLGYTAIISIVLGIVGLVMVSKAKKMGYFGSECTTATVLSIVGIAGGTISLIVTAVILVVSAMNWLDLFSYYVEILPF